VGPRATVVKAHVDSLAEELSKRTGSHWEILRGRVPANPSRPSAGNVMRYGLKITREFGGEKYSHTFQAHRPMKLLELQRWLASISDMVVMGYIPVAFQPTPPPKDQKVGP
jgi:hypothetical protein